ncbi:MAG: type I-C CRISPR-associated protein Cas8c/Csd1 [Lachnospiraceae bacterium]|nr:type I-C CRISPR-associated protein Cas8c/Csd1 [Lachnospiraceae bacterium]
MYTEIYNFAVDNNLTNQPNTAKKEIAAYINLDENGEYINIDVIEKKNRKKVNCPDIGSLQFAGQNANPIVEKFGAVFFKHKADEEIGKEELKKLNKHNGWLNIMKDGAQNCEEINKIYQFIEKYEEDDDFSIKLQEDLLKTKIKDADFVSFRIDGMNAESCEWWRDWLNSYLEKKKPKSEGDEKIVSSITGKLVESLDEKSAPKVIVSVTGTGSYVSSFGNSAFESYGLMGNKGASMGKEEAETIKIGLEYLLSKEEHYNSNFGIIHWYKGQVLDDLIGESLRVKGEVSLNEEEELEYEEDDDSVNINFDQKYGDLLNSAIVGRLSDKLPETAYYIAKFNVPTKGRMFLSDFHEGKYNELYNNLTRWYEDSKLLVLYKDDEKKYRRKYSIVVNIYSLIFSLLSERDTNSDDKFKKLDNMLGEAKLQLLYSVYEGKQLPVIYFRLAINRFNNQVIKGKNVIKDRKFIKWLQIIKIYLIRNKEVNAEMNNEKKTKAYVCGQLFAIYEKIQNMASGNLNVNVTQKYFGAVQKAPQLFFPKLANMSIVHMKKIKNEAAKIWIDKVLNEVVTEIGTSFPEKFSEVEKGEFILGYYNQRTDFYKTNTEKEN